MEIKPSYYDGFCCSADKCPMTCCMQWKIAVDEDTYDSWKKIKFNGKTLTSYVKDVDGGKVIALNKSGKCPFINEMGLCNLVISHGDGILSQTCDIFPRQIHDFGNRKEYSLVSCCPEVIDILHQAKMVEFIGYPKEMEEDELFGIRNCMMEVVKNEEYPLNTALLMAYYILLETYEKEDAKITAKEFDELQEGIRKVCVFWKDTFDENNELWLDMVENYRKEGLYTEYIEEISQLAEKLSQGYEEDGIKALLEEFETEFEKYERLFRNYLVSEFFTNLLIPDSDLEDMVVMMQWIGMEYVMMRQALFLKWLQSGKEELAYETVRDYMVVISRMTGYDEEDIVEYLENSFQSLIWSWSYMALIIGNKEE